MSSAPLRDKVRQFSPTPPASQPTSQVSACILSTKMRCVCVCVCTFASDKDPLERVLIENVLQRRRQRIALGFGADERSVGRHGLW